MLTYLYLVPGTGYYKRLRDKFGPETKLFLNADMALHLIIKHLPLRQPGMEVLMDSTNVKRFSRVVSRLGLKVVAYSGQNDLIKKAESKQVLLVMVPDTYREMHPRFKKRFAVLPATKLMYQNRKRPRPIALEYDLYMWEPRQLPRSVSGTVVTVESARLDQLSAKLSASNASVPRLANARMFADIVRALRGYESKFRRIDRRPPKVLARILYDFYI